MESEKYNEESIKSLDWKEHIRLRPGMYIGDPHDGSALHHCIWEVVDNSVDEHLAGFNNKIEVDINPGGSLSVRDFGRGIPVGMHEKEKKSALEVVMTVLHAGGKFDKDSYKVSGGLHGVGVSCVNALSEHLIARVYRDGKIYEQEYKIGSPLYPVKEVGETEKRGTEVTFLPDKTIFQDIATIY